MSRVIINPLYLVNDMAKRYKGLPKKKSLRKKLKKTKKYAQMIKKV